MGPEGDAEEAEEAELLPGLAHAEEAGGLPEEGRLVAYAEVRRDFQVLKEWSDVELRDTLGKMTSTPAELLIYSPLGPFVVLSSIAIFRDGLSVWGIPPCRDYLGLCTNWSPWLPFPLPFPLPF